jgi:hypothetical protein
MTLASTCQTSLKIRILLRNHPSQCPLFVVMHDVVENNIANGTLHNVVHILSSKYPTLSGHTSKYNVIYCYTTCTVFPARVFTKRTNALQHYVQISRTKFI